jgi:hypothetical protein
LAGYHISIEITPKKMIFDLLDSIELVDSNGFRKRFELYLLGLVLVVD